MDAVLRVDLQALRTGFAVWHELVHTGGAVAAFGPGKLGQVGGHGGVGVLQRQVRGLVFFVVGAAQEHAAEAVERELAVGLGVVDARAGGRRAQAGVVGVAAV